MACSAFGDSTGPIDFSRSMASTGQSDISTYASRSREPCRIVNRCLEGERCDRAHTRRGHEPADLRITASQFCNLTVKLPDLLLDGIARFEQRPDRSHQLRTTLDQLLGSYSEDIERATSDHETEVLEKAAHLVLEIALDLDQQCPTPQQCSDREAVDILDMHLLEPTGLLALVWLDSGITPCCKSLFAPPIK